MDRPRDARDEPGVESRVWGVLPDRGRLATLGPSSPGVPGRVRVVLRTNHCKRSLGWESCRRVVVGSRDTQSGSGPRREWTPVHTRLPCQLVPLHVVLPPRPQESEPFVYRECPEEVQESRVELRSLPLRSQVRHEETVEVLDSSSFGD